MNWSIVVDVVVVALVVLILVLGVKRGFVRSCVGLVSAVAVLAGAILLTSPVTGLITSGTDWDGQIAESLESPIAEKLPNAYATVYYTDYDNDVNTEVELVYKIDGEVHPFDEVFNDNGVIKRLGLVKLIRPAVENLLHAQAEEENVALDNYNNTINLIDGVTAPIATAILTVAVFFALIIILWIVLWILLKIFKKISSTIYIAHFLDKMLGGIFGLVMGVLVVLIILTILQVLSPLSFMEPVNNFLEETVVTKFVMDNNFLYRFLADSINIESLMSGIK